MSLKDFNFKLANKLADMLSTMAMFYLITFLVFSILIFQMPKTPLEWIAFIVQTFFQGVALPVLAFVSKVESEKTNKIITDIYDRTLDQLQEIKDMQIDLNSLLEDQKIEVDLEAKQNELLQDVLYYLKDDEDEGSEI